LGRESLTRCPSPKTVEGATFLNYEQMIDGIAVFQGQVQVAINAKGQVISINEGLVIPDAGINTNLSVPKTTSRQ
jgi:Zn-dependent metalloprotease